jgi:hypothetical protein
MVTVPLQGAGSADGLAVALLPEDVIPAEIRGVSIGGIVS